MSLRTYRPRSMKPATAGLVNGAAGACRGDMNPAWVNPRVNPELVERAEAMCSGCPILRACQAAARGADFTLFEGVMGGKVFLRETSEVDDLEVVAA